jgi:hypothetical protein
VCEGMHAHTLVWLLVRSVSAMRCFFLCTPDALSRKPPVSARVLCIDREGWGANELDLLAPVYLDLTPVCTGIDEIITKRGQMDADSDYPSSGRKAMAFGA